MQPLIGKPPDKSFDTRKFLSSAVATCAIIAFFVATRFIPTHPFALQSTDATHDTKRNENHSTVIPTALEAPPVKQTPPVSPGVIRLGFVGDIMLARQVEAKINTAGGKDYRFPFMRAKKILAQYDVLFGNLEGPISDKGSDQGSTYSFRMNPEAIKGLTYAGFGVLSVANNHSGDWGKEAFIDTLYRLEDASVSYIGGGLNEERAYEPVVKTVGDTRIAYLGFSQFGKNYFEARGPFLGLAVIDLPKIKTSIVRARADADIVVVSFHFGDEYQKEPNDYQQKVARAAIDFGADLVVGHHPHVVEPLERYERGYIAYSLGNFIFDQNFSEETMGGALLDVVVEHKAIRDATLLPVTLNSSFQAEIK